MGGAQELRATPRRPGTPPGHSEPFRAATRALRALQAATYNYLSFHNSIYRRPPSHSELLRARGAQELRATPSHSERLLRATRALRARIDFAGLPSYSELLRVRGAQELRATPSCFQKLRALRAASWSCKLGKDCLQRGAEFRIPDCSFCSEPASSERTALKSDADSHRRLELLLRACRLRNCKLFLAPTIVLPVGNRVHF